MYLRGYDLYHILDTYNIFLNAHTRKSFKNINTDCRSKYVGHLG